MRREQSFEIPIGCLLIHYLMMNSSCLFFAQIAFLYSLVPSFGLLSVAQSLSSVGVFTSASWVTSDQAFLGFQSFKYGLDLLFFIFE